MERIAPARNGPRHIPVFDSLRGYAICGVLMVHCALPFGGVLKGASARNLQFGAFGVQLFYIVSACTLFWSMESRTSADRRPLRAFFLRRFFRIAPAFWVAIAASLCVYGVAPRYNAPGGLSVFDVLSTVFFVHGAWPTSINSVVGGGWSIAVEMPFYLLVPFCFCYIRSLSQAARFVVATYFLGLLANALYTWAFQARFVGQEYLLEQFLTLWLPAQLPVFGMGFMLFFLVRDRLSRPEGLATELPATVGTKPDYLVLWSVLLWGWWSCYHAKTLIIPPLLSAGLLLMVFSWMLAWWPVRLLVNPFVGYVGKISYSMYLCHFLLLTLLAGRIDIAASRFRPEVRYLMVLGVVFSVAVVVSTAGYFLIEKPMIYWGKVTLERLGWGPAGKARVAAPSPPAATAPL